MAADSIARGDEFFDKAQKKLKSFSFFGKGHYTALLEQYQKQVQHLRACMLLASGPALSYQRIKQLTRVAASTGFFCCMASGFTPRIAVLYCSRPCWQQD
jgi:hypothetical protein